MKIVSNEVQSPRQQGRTEAIILFAVAGQTFAIAASAVAEIRSTDSLSSAASAMVVNGISKVRHRLRRGTKWYYVVDTCVHFDLPASRPSLLLILRNSTIAVLVDQIDRIETISRLMAVPQSFSGPERTWYRGLALIDDNVVPILSPSGFLTRSELAQLDAFAEPAATFEERETSLFPSETQRPLP
ncbi:MAG TPA: chemotaxis protein CheW [Candidatus Acidoferrales bacterium]|nr:chemotaxis protein CheW [Candidatus Acidoferrales bacterium]